MGDAEKKSVHAQNENSGEKTECYLCKRIKWITFEAPAKLQKFLHCKKTIFGL
jgi:hypothetical protein